MIKFLIIIFIIFFQQKTNFITYLTNFILNIIYLIGNFLVDENIQYLTNIWLSLELINWLLYLFMYTKIINPNLLYFSKQEIDKVIKKIDNFDKHELEHMIKGCIVYDKQNHKQIDYENLDVRDLSKKEIFYLLGYTLFGIEQNKLFLSEQIKKIYKLLRKIEYILGYEFKLKDCNRFLYKSWGREFINFHFRPLIFQLPIRILVNLFHYYMTLKLKFKYKTCPKSKIGYLYKNKTTNKKNLIFIHGFGLGYIPYIRRLLKLNEEFNLIIMILPNISSYTYYDDLKCGYFPSHNLIRDSFYDFMIFLKINKINILSHSFGTYITQIIRNDSRNILIDKIILIDPIIFWIGCFKMSLYIDKITQQGTDLVYWIIETLTNYLIFKCLYLRYICYRVMFGPDFLIYNSKELEGKNILLVLEYNDKVIPADIIYNKVKDNKISYYYLNEADHGSVLLSSKFDNIFDIIIRYY